jgi:hypothetical protein
MQDAIFAERGGARIAEDKDFAFVTSVKAALREHEEEAAVVIEEEVAQFVEKKVFHPVLLRGMSRAVRKRILPSKMFIKEKFLPDGAFDKLKARLVAGGHRQDRALYKDDDTSAPPVAHSSVMSVCAIAACEGRLVACATLEVHF